VNQTIAAWPRAAHQGKLVLGGPLTFSRCLRESFDKTLGVTDVPGTASVRGLGAAFYSDQTFDLWRWRTAAGAGAARPTAPSRLFSSQGVRVLPVPARQGRGARCLRRTTPPRSISASTPLHHREEVVMDQEARILFTDYRPNLATVP
jgi:hypothetical protein